MFILFSKKKPITVSKIILILGIVYPFSASAFYCEEKSTGKKYYSGTSTNDLIVPITGDLVIGDSLLFNLGDYFFCVNDVPTTYIDVVETSSTGISINLNPAFDIKSYINDKLQVGVIKENTEVLRIEDANRHDVPIKVEYQVKNTPGIRQIIRKGDLLGSVMLHKYSIPAQQINNFTWRLIAGNNAVLVTGTCHINNGDLLEVDFGSVSRSTLVSAGEANPNRQYLYVPYRCDDSITQSINISFSAQQTSFSTELLQTSNENLGIQLFQGSTLIKPLELFRTRLINGRGGDGFNFSLVKNSNAEVTTGAFSAAGMIVMSVD